ncbi:ATP-grasp fold amidoligase family protein [Helicobacter equorum]
MQILQPQGLDSPKIENGNFHTSLQNFKVPDDYKMHVMQNNISHIEVITNRYTMQQEIAMDTKWQKIPFDYEKKASKIPQKPVLLDKMIIISLRLAQVFRYVRIDLYCIKTRIYIGEFTFTPAGGTDKFTPNEWDAKLGSLWHIEN